MLVSNKPEILCGVPQGFVLQPLLFPHIHTNTIELYLPLAHNDDLQFNSNAEMNNEKASTLFNIVSDGKLALYCIFHYIFQENVRVIFMNDGYYIKAFCFSVISPIFNFDIVEHLIIIFE